MFKHRPLPLASSFHLGIARRLFCPALMMSLALTGSACGDDEGSDESGGDDAQLSDMGTMRAGIVMPVETSLDVASVRFTIGKAGGGTLIETVALEPGRLPASRSAELAGSRFAEFVLALEPGSYHIHAQPLNAAGEPSGVCSDVYRPGVAVVSNQTAQLLLVSQCGQDESGGLDVILGFNHHPIITDLTANPSTIACVDTPITLGITAEDVDQDTLSYAWSLGASPSGSSPSLTPAGTSSQFTGDIAGAYSVDVTVNDGQGGSTSLNIPVYLSDDPADCGSTDAGSTTSGGDTAGSTDSGTSTDTTDTGADSGTETGGDACGGAVPCPGIATDMGFIDSVATFFAPQTQVVEETVDGATYTSKVDASAGGNANQATNPWVYVKFTQTGLEQVQITDNQAITDTTWHLALKRASIRLNSGDGGEACVGVAMIDADDADYDSVTSVPPGTVFAIDDAIYANDNTCEYTADPYAGPDLAFTGWYDYNQSTHVLNPNGNTFLIDLEGDESAVVKLTHLDFYVEPIPGVRVGGVHTLKWAYIVP